MFHGLSLSNALFVHCRETQTSYLALKEMTYQAKAIELLIYYTDRVSTKSILNVLTSLCTHIIAVNQYH